MLNVSVSSPCIPSFPLLNVGFCQLFYNSVTSAVLIVFPVLFAYAIVFQMSAAASQRSNKRVRAKQLAVERTIANFLKQISIVFGRQAFECCCLCMR